MSDFEYVITDYSITPSVKDLMEAACAVLDSLYSCGDDDEGTFLAKLNSEKFQTYLDIKKRYSVNG